MTDLKVDGPNIWVHPKRMKTMNETVSAALKQLLSALEAAADAEGNCVAELNAYFVMEQEVQNAANHCTQSLYWAGKQKKKLKERDG